MPGTRVSSLTTTGHHAGGWRAVLAPTHPTTGVGGPEENRRSGASAMHRNRPESVPVFHRPERLRGQDGRAGTPRACARNDGTTDGAPPGAQRKDGDAVPTIQQLVRK